MPLIDEELPHSILGGFYAVYNTLGFGFAEHVYAHALEQELSLRERSVNREIAVPIAYKGVIITNQRLDMLVDNKVVLELKCTPVLHPSASQQLLNYLRVTTYEVGLLLHFGPDPYFARLVDSRKRQN